MAKKITKKVIQQVMEKLEKANASPEEKLKLLKEMTAYLQKADLKVKKIIAKVGKEVKNKL